MKGRQLSAREIEFHFPGCSCLCASLVIDHLGADLSFTAVIMAKCKAIHHPLFLPTWSESLWTLVTWPILNLLYRCPQMMALLSLQGALSSRTLVSEKPRERTPEKFGTGCVSLGDESTIRSSYCSSSRWESSSTHPCEVFKSPCNSSSGIPWCLLLPSVGTCTPGHIPQFTHTQNTHKHQNKK